MRNARWLPASLIVFLFGLAMVACSNSAGGGGGETASYTVSYDGNGANKGSVPIDLAKYESGDSATVKPQGGLLRSWYGFSGWNTKADGSGTASAAGDKVVVSQDLKLYAQWTAKAWGPVGTGMDTEVYSLARGSSGVIYAGGSFTLAGGNPASRVAKWDGSSWSSLSSSGVSGVSGGSGIVSALAGAFDASDDVYAGGDFTTAGGGAAYYIAKWEDTNDWLSFGAPGYGTNGSVQALATDASGNLYLGGLFTMAGASTANYVAKWNGSAWSALGAGMDNFVYALAYRSGKLYAGGFFTSAGGVGANYIAVWDGSSWSALGSGLNGGVFALAFDSSGNLYAGGAFTSAGGNPAKNVAKWDGSSWSALGSGANAAVYALAFDSSGNLFAGGAFTTAGGSTANRVALWNGSAWSALPNDMNGKVYALLYDPSGSLYAGGAFNTVGGVSAPYIARLEE